MAWDEAAQHMAVNVIAKVESSGAWDAINYNDPITIGLMQWYGTRAAQLLNGIKNNGTGLGNDERLDTLRSQVDSQSQSSRWWTTRYLSGSEGSALKPILRANKDVQSAQISGDIDDYRAAANRIGMNPDSNTNAVIFFCIMYHQTPARAIRIVGTAGPTASIDRIYAVCMNDDVFSRYRSRYKQAVDIIKSGVAPDLIELNDDDAPIPDGNGQGEDNTDDNLERVKSAVKYLSVEGDQILVHLRSDAKVWAVPDGRGRFFLGATQDGIGEDVPDSPDDTGIPDPEPDDDVPPSADVAARRAKVRSQGLSMVGKYGYTNDSRRINMEASGWGDCSAFARAVYSHIGVKLGLLTSSQYTQGKRITTSLSFNESQLEVGDLIYIQWKNPGWNSGKVTDHVEMYIGDNTLIGHPGPGRGPRTTPLNTYKTLFRKVWVQRHIV